MLLIYASNFQFSGDQLPKDVSIIQLEGGNLIYAAAGNTVYVVYKGKKVSVIS